MVLNLYNIYNKKNKKIGLFSFSNIIYMVHYLKLYYLIVFSALLPQWKNTYTNYIISNAIGNLTSSQNYYYYKIEVIDCEPYQIMINYTF